MADTPIAPALPGPADTGPMAALKQIRGLRDIPLMRQFVLLASLAAAIAAGLSLFNWAQQPAYTPIYEGMNDKDASAVADALRQANIPFKLDPISGAVTVPGDKLHDARLRAAAAGLPKGSSMGMEMLQQDPGLGTSQFIEGARYQLALETELARSVASLQPIKSARVHLAMPKPSAFTQNREPPSASVLVELQPGRMLEAGQVEAIEHMVAASVPNLTPSNVTVIDQLGRLLSNNDPNSEIAQSTEHYQYTRRVETDYQRRIEELLAPMLGMGHISAKVAADLDFAQTEEARESYKPDGSVVRSEQTSEQTQRTPITPTGLPGALSNQPPSTTAQPVPPVPAPGQNGQPGQARNADGSTASTEPTSQSKSATRNYELDRTVSHTRHPVGSVRRLSVAVLVDYRMKAPDPATPAVGPDGKPVEGAAPAAPQPVPLTAEEIAKVEALVKQAVGFDADRGDTVTVQNAPFLTTPIEPLPELPFYKRAGFSDYVRQGAGALIVLVLILAVLRPLARTFVYGDRVVEAEAVAPPAQTTALEAVGGGEAAEEGAAQAALAGAVRNTEALAPPDDQIRLEMARKAVAEDPKKVAQVVKTWLSEDG